MSEKQVKTEQIVTTREVADDEVPSEAVVAAVAAVADADPTRMRPLAESIDPDALDALFADWPDGTARHCGHTRFSFLDYEVVVSSAGLVLVVDPGT